MFEFEVFRKQMYCIEESTCDIVWTFRRPRSHSALSVVIRRPGNCSPLAPSLRHCDRINVSWFCQVLKKMKQLLWQTKSSFLNFRPILEDCMFEVVLTLLASINIIHLLCYVAVVRTAAFVTDYAQISFLVFFMFSFCVVPKDVLKTASVDKR